jgi:hypothetical protein
MADTKIDELEAAIKEIPGVLGCAILRSADGKPQEIQAFTQTGVNREEIHTQVLHEVTTRDLETSMNHIYVFELEAESYFGDLESLERAVEFAEQEARSEGPKSAAELQPVAPATDGAPPPTPTERPRVSRVALSSSSWTSEAKVSLGDVVGEASAEKTPHGLKVVAEATLSAAGKIVPEATFQLQSASLVNVAGKEAVLILVDEDGTDMLGSALTRGGPITEATVRATLDAINRRLAHPKG